MEILEDSAGLWEKKFNFTAYTERPSAKTYNCHEFFTINQSSCELPNDFAEKQLIFLMCHLFRVWEWTTV
jgi:hypothetical protein